MSRRRLLTRGLRALIKRSGYDLIRRETRAYSDFEGGDYQIINEVAPFTRTSPERIYALIQATRYIVRTEVPGAIVECGVWRGGSMMATAKVLLELRREDRDLCLFDTFTGMTNPSPVDVDW